MGKEVPGLGAKRVRADGACRRGLRGRHSLCTARAVADEHGLLLAGETDDRAQVDQVRVLAGGEATFLVRYFAGIEELAGSGALQPTASGPLQVTTAQSRFAAARDWLRVSASGAGSGQIMLSFAGAAPSILPVILVDASSISSVTVSKQDDSGKHDGDLLWVFARALDGMGHDVGGGSFGWSLDGNTLPTKTFDSSEPTDVVSYQFKARSNDSLKTQLGTMSASVPIHANAGTASADSTATVGCSASAWNGRGSGGAAMLGFVLAGAWIRIERRRVCAQTPKSA